MQQQASLKRNWKGNWCCNHDHPKNDGLATDVFWGYPHLHVFAGCSFRRLVHSLKLTFSPLKIDSWNTILSFWGPAYFQELVLLVLGRVSTPKVTQLQKTFDVRRTDINGTLRFFRFPQTRKRAGLYPR